MAEQPDATRPILSCDGAAASEATDVVAHLVKELQAGLDQHDADTYNRHFAGDVVWGSPFGAVVRGYEPLHAIHSHLLEQGTGGPSSRYETDTVLAPAPGVVVAHVRRIALDSDHLPLEAISDAAGAFSEMALYVLIRRDGTWWLAAGQNTPIRRGPSAIVTSSRIA